MTPPRVLVIAGSDSGGGAGIQADIKTGFALGVHVSTALTAVTAQNSVGVQGVWVLAAAAVRAQIRSVLDDIGADVIKTGMLATAEIAGLVADEIERSGLPAVIDPVLASTTGAMLLTDDALEVYRHRLIPLATVVTPNLPEVRALTGVDVRAAGDLRAAADAMLALGCRWALIKGGHLDSDATDLLAGAGGVIELTGERIDTANTHGTGCTLATAIAARLAYGDDVPAAVRAAKEFVTRGIRNSYPLGSGVGPVAQWTRLV
ncbi:MAG: hydroxymethylpyrimidine/phosphomethylpyrimidine kinase [Frankiaceae bacterium]|nr:hydroxymethylpyrimidine/phosphomethylpyrimidine kinase [Frankiaceae bacterium]